MSLFVRLVCAFRGHPLVHYSFHRDVCHCRCGRDINGFRW